jgi:hypothetical protein
MIKETIPSELFKEKEPNICYLPFNGYRDLYKKCEEILSTLKGYHSFNIKNLIEQGIEFADMKFGVAIDWGQLNDSQKEYILKSNEYKIFSTGLIDKYNIIGNTNILNV